MGGGCHSLRRLCFRTCLKIENNKEYCYEQSNTHVGRIMLSAEPGLDRIDTGAYLVPVGWDALQALVWYTHTPCRSPQGKRVPGIPYMSTLCEKV